jgi:hypothetical protein
MLEICLEQPTKLRIIFPNDRDGLSAENRNKDFPLNNKFVMYQREYMS